MLKPTANYRMGKATKSMLRLMKGTKEQRDGWKRAFIQAELAAELASRSTGKRNRDESPE